jgi:anti-sigma factor ChrR (cupin superfamily)
MSPHATLDEEARDQAALFALDTLAGREAAAYEEHLAACPLCRAEVEAARSGLADLALLAPAVAPPAGLRDRLLRRARDQEPAAAAGPVQVWKAWSPALEESGGSAYVPGAGSSFEPTGVDGVEVRRLYVDASSDRVTMLVRMRAGASYPAHVHGGPEECYVIAGDLRVGEIHMRAGDYQRVRRGYRHGVQTTDGGCLLFIVSSLRDELHEPGAGA